MDRAITFHLPESLAQEAAKAGLLTNEAFARWIEKELERRTRVEEFFTAIEQISKVEPHLTLEEIEAEIAAYRTESK